MPNNPDPRNIVWDEDAIEWDKPNPPQMEKEKQAGFDFPFALTNLTEGAWGKLKDLVTPSTYIGLLEIVRMGHPLGPAIDVATGQDPLEKQKQVGKAIFDDFLNKYGSWDKIKSTFQNTPIEPLLDASMILTGGGTATAKLPGWLGRIGKVSQTVGMAGDPFNIATVPIKGLGWLFSPATKKISNFMYRSSAKISQIDKNLSLDEIKKIAQRGLDENLWMSQSKLKEVKSKMDNVRRSINEGLDAAEKRGDFVDTWKAANEMDKMKDIYGKRVIPIPELDSMIDDLKQIMLDAHGERIPPKLAQEMKMNSQKFLDNAYGKLSAIAKESEKYATSSVRQQLEEIHPALKQLNPKMKEYKDLKEAIEKVVRKEMEAPVVEGLSLWNAVARRSIDNPFLKSRVAVALNATRKMKFSPTTTISREILYKEKSMFPTTMNRRIEMEE